MKARGIFASLVWCAVAGAQPVYNTTPDWSSADQQVSTGAAFADLNLDGWLDLIVANGNDISRQRVVVYYNTGAGTLQTSPGWQSADLAFNGHCDVADVNGDGWPDVAVAVLLHETGPSAKVYLNNAGTLSSTPSWTASIKEDSFGVAFGDMNSDGRPDLAVASGEAYTGTPVKNAVYLNTGGTLAAAPSWQTADNRNFNNALWIDADRNGTLDLLYVSSNSDTFVYHNLGSTLSTTPTWRTLDIRNQFSLMATVGDVTGDGRSDLVIADNNQLFAGSGRFRLYPGQAAGNFATTASWTYFDGYASAVVLGDIDNDRDLDLCSGAWFDRTRYFLNTGTGLPAAPSFTSGGTSTVEKITLGDVDNKALRVKVSNFTPSPGQHLYWLPEQIVQRVISVEVDGTALTPAQYTSAREQGWVSVGPTAATAVKIAYLATRSLDMAVSNWDDTRPNQLYFNKLAVPCAADFNEDGFLNGDDFDQFDAAFEVGELTADFNLDGFVSGDDFDAFVGVFEGGC